MAYPTELIRRAKELRRNRKTPVWQAREAALTVSERAPLNIRHGNYDRLMRRHDRLHPRHLDG